MVCIENGTEILVIPLWTADSCAKGKPGLSLGLLHIHGCTPQKNGWCSTSAGQRPGQAKDMVGSWEFIWGGGRSGCERRTWFPAASHSGRLGVSERAVTHGKYLCGKLGELFLNEFAVWQALDWCESTIWFLIPSSAHIVIIHDRIAVKHPETKRHV